jgi:hypothetical protein
MVGKKFRKNFVLLMFAAILAVAMMAPAALAYADGPPNYDQPVYKDRVNRAPQIVTAKAYKYDTKAKSTDQYYSKVESNIPNFPAIGQKYTIGFGYSHYVYYYNGKADAYNAASVKADKKYLKAVKKYTKIKSVVWYVGTKQVSKKKTFKIPKSAKGKIVRAYVTYTAKGVKGTQAVTLNFGTYSTNTDIDEQLSNKALPTKLIPAAAGRAYVRAKISSTGTLGNYKLTIASNGLVAKTDKAWDLAYYKSFEEMKGIAATYTWYAYANGKYTKIAGNVKSIDYKGTTGHVRCNVVTKGKGIIPSVADVTFYPNDNYEYDE